VKVIGTCPHCGCYIYSKEKDSRKLPVPEYICNCRFNNYYFQFISYPVISYPVISYPVIPYPPWPTYPNPYPSYYDSNIKVNDNTDQNTLGVRQ
jgi:hypothetical protein